MHHKWLKTFSPPTWVANLWSKNTHNSLWNITSKIHSILGTVPGFKRFPQLPKYSQHVLEGSFSPFSLLFKPSIGLRACLQWIRATSVWLRGSRLCSPAPCSLPAECQASPAAVSILSTLASPPVHLRLHSGWPTQTSVEVAVVEMAVAGEGDDGGDDIGAYS